MVFHPTDFIEIEKFIQNKLGKRITTPKKKISGVFKHEGSDETYEGDIFMAYPVNRGDALESYQAYIDYFNYTIQGPHELPRIAVSAEWIEEVE